MLHYSDTGKTKSGEIKISRPVFALLITGTGLFIDILNEKISIDIERNQGSTTNIANQHPLARILGLATHGIPAIKQSNGFWSAILPLAGGAIPLKDSESIKVSLGDLRSSINYTVSSIESPQVALTPFKYDQKVMVSDDVAREIEIQGFRKMFLQNIDVISQIRLKHMNGTTNTYEVAELLALAEADDPYYLNDEASIYMSPDNGLIMDVSEITHIEVVKASGTPVFLSLRN
jgi:hypothetical protein